MQRRMWIALCFLLFFFPSFTYAASLAELMADPTLSAASQTIGGDPADARVWTRWNAQPYALAEDDAALWIAMAGGVVRWDKVTHTHQRFTQINGLPHFNVYAVAVDAFGNRWFGGDGGLSRLDPQERWSHFTTANSSLYSNTVDGIVVTANNTLWLSHGSLNDTISRLDTDGTWRWYPNRQVAVASNYDLIRQTQNANRLWTVAGDEVWVGCTVYNGTTWLDRCPPDFKPEVDVVAADETGAIWVLGKNATDSTRTAIYMWNGVVWAEIPVPCRLQICVGVTNLAGGAGNTAWIGWGVSVGGYTAPDEAGIGKLPGETFVQATERLAPIAALLPTRHGNGVWAVGAGWLREPDGLIYDFQDAPAYPQVKQAIMDATNRLWLYSSPSTGSPVYNELQVVSDQGTTQLVDDIWHREEVTPTSQTAGDPIAFERSRSGDLWVHYSSWYSRCRFPQSVLRRHGESWLSYELPRCFLIEDIFAQDERHVWFAYDTFIDAQEQWGVLALDDGGTPGDTTDDQWSDYPGMSEGRGGVVAHTSGGTLWYGNSAALYQYRGQAWQLYTPTGVCDLIPTDNGGLIVHLQPCASRLAFLILADATSTLTMDVDGLSQQYWDTVRTATDSHRLLTVAPDGAVWYTVTETPHLEPRQNLLLRRTATDLTLFDLPFASSAVQSLQVDAHNHVWIVADSSLWRLSPKPDFSLTIQPAFELVAPSQTRMGLVQTHTYYGYQGSIELSTSGLPTEMTATLAANPINAGEQVTMTLAIAPDMSPGIYTASLNGASPEFSHTTSITIVVATEPFKQHLPVITR